MSKLIITRKDGSTVDVEPNKMWEPRTDAELVEVLRGEVERLTAELKAAREALADCRDAARGHWRDDWNEKYFSRIEAVNNIACEALESRE